MRRILFVIVLATAVFPFAGNTQELGTLFTSSEERAYLDYLRQEFLASSAETGFDIDDAAVPEIPVDENEAEAIEFHLGGIVTRVDGGRTVWLNGQPIREAELPSNANIVFADGVAALRIITPDNGFIIKPGQTVDISTGEFWEAFERQGIFTQAEIIPEQGASTQAVQSNTDGAFSEDTIVEQGAEAPSTISVPIDLTDESIPPDLLQAIRDLQQN